MPKICQRCGNEFPLRMIIDGKMRSLDARKMCIECSPFGSHNTRSPAVFRSFNAGEKRCPKCQQTKPLVDFHIRSGELRSGKPSGYCRDCYNGQVLTRIRSLKEALCRYKGGKCVGCGYDRYFGSMDFHHLDPAHKDFTISDYRKASVSDDGVLPKDLRDELDKCVLVCACCHREIHAGVRVLSYLAPT